MKICYKSIGAFFSLDGGIPSSYFENNSQLDCSSSTMQKEIVLNLSILAILVFVALPSQSFVIELDKEKLRKLKQYLKWESNHI